MNTKHFIKVGNTLQSKNKVQKLVLETLQKLDQTLWPSVDDASDAVKTAFDKAVNQYTGSAKKPQLLVFIPKDNSLSIYVEDLIYLHLYAIKKYKP